MEIEYKIDETVPGKFAAVVFYNMQEICFTPSRNDKAEARADAELLAAALTLYLAPDTRTSSAVREMADWFKRA